MCIDYSYNLLEAVLYGNNPAMVLETSIVNIDRYGVGAQSTQQTTTSKNSVS